MTSTQSNHKTASEPPFAVLLDLPHISPTIVPHKNFTFRRTSSTGRVSDEKKENFWSCCSLVEFTVCNSKKISCVSCLSGIRAQPCDFLKSHRSWKLITGKKEKTPFLITSEIKHELTVFWYYAWKQNGCIELGRDALVKIMKFADWGQMPVKE